MDRAGGARAGLRPKGGGLGIKGCAFALMRDVSTVSAQYGKITFPLFSLFLPRREAMSETDDKRTRAERFRELDRRRCVVGAPMMRTASKAGVTRRAYLNWLTGVSVPSWRSVGRLAAAIAELEREALGQ